MYIRDESSHRHSEEGLDDIEGGPALNECLASRQDGRCHQDERDPTVSADLFAHEATGQLRRKEDNEKDLIVVSGVLIE